MLKKDMECGKGEVCMYVRGLEGMWKFVICGGVDYNMKLMLCGYREMRV